MTSFESYARSLRGVTTTEIDQVLARRNLIDFASLVNPSYRPAPHHHLIASKLEAVARGEIKRLIILAPPRHGKSELVSRLFPAWLLGNNPDEQVIGCSYNDDTAKDFNRDVQQYMLADAYRPTFPDARLNDRNVVSVADSMALRNARVFEMVGRRGYYRAAGVHGGTITGKGATVGIIDDPIKNHEEAYSITMRNRVWNWYTSTFYTRGEGAFAEGGDIRIVICVTPWHEDDIVGRLRKRMKEDPDADQWEVVRLPAMLDTAPASYDQRDPGDPLWPEKYDAKALRRIRANVGERDWQALYQCRPTAQEGGMFKRGWWKRYDETPERMAALCSYVFQSWDMTFKSTTGGSFVVGQVWGTIGGRFYLLHQVRERMDFITTVQRFVNVCRLFPKSTAKLVEDKANGPAVISALRDRIPGIIAITPKGSKEARAAAQSPLVESGNVYLPKDEHAPWVGAFIEEHAAFPAGANDDQVDATSQALQHGHKSGIAIMEKLVQL